MELKSQRKNDIGRVGLCRMLVFSAIGDLSSEKYSKSALSFFLSDNFKRCCDECGFDFKEIISVVHETSKFNDLQTKVRGQQLIKKLRGQDVNRNGGSSRKTNGKLQDCLSYVFRGSQKEERKEP